MSGLVSYDSSDDEDGLAPHAAAAAASGSLPVPNGTQNDVDSIVERAAEAVDSDAPMVGPTMPAYVQLEQQQGSHSDAVSDRIDTREMSEQDLIRHLTSPTHPMTALPASPPGSPNPAVEAKFKKFLELKKQGLHFNEDLANKSSFRNPALLTTLKTRAGIEGHALYTSSLPTDIWNPSALPSYASKEELAKSQQSIRDSEKAQKKALSRTGVRSIDFHPAATRG